VAERAMVAWAEGHASYINAAVEDPFAWPPGGGGGTGGEHNDHDHDSDHDEGDATGVAIAGGAGGLAAALEVEPTDTLRFGSVGQDCQVRSHKHTWQQATQIFPATSSTAFHPLVYCDKWHPMTWQELLARLYCQVCLWDMAVEGTSGVGTSASAAMAMGSSPGRAVQVHPRLTQG